MLNKAIVSSRLNLLQDYRDDIDQVLQLEPNNQKALYQKAKSLIFLGEYIKARKLINNKKDIIQ